MQEATAGSSGYPSAGTYHYAVTDVYVVELASGENFVTESAPSDTDSVVLDGETHTGVSLALTATSNTQALGFNQTLLHRNVYRSTKSGVWPNLGQVAKQISVSAITFIDTFETSGETLGTPSMDIIYVGAGAYASAGGPPPFLDATLHQGSVVAIPANGPFRIVWSAKGFPEYYPVPHNFPFLSSATNDRLTGVVSLGDILLVMTRSRILRVRGLPFATAAETFNVDGLEIHTLSPSEGLAGTPLAYCLFHSQKGHGVCAWVSDSGIWMTDGSLVSERGLGVRKLTSHKNWRGDVDLSRLDETELTFDPELQVIVFDYYDRAGTRKCEYLHVSPQHWVQSGEDQMTPKITGPHTLTALRRAVGENGGVWRHWSLNTTSLKVLSERTGLWDDGARILTHIESGWIYPIGPRNRFHLYRGTLGHGDWGSGAVFDLDLLVRNDETGAIQTIAKRGLSLRGERMTDLGWLNVSGQSLKVIIRHDGSTVSDGSASLYISPPMFEMEAVDEVRKG
jgi:hypothetical protein